MHQSVCHHFLSEHISNARLSLLMLALDFHMFAFLILNISCGVYYYNKGQTHYYIQGLLMESSLTTRLDKLLLLMEVCSGQFHHI